jgi:hypothetical protein
MSDVAPGQADIVQVAIAPLRQFPALPASIAPDLKNFAQLGQKARPMMICHQSM